MIHIEKDQKVCDTDTLRVAEATGDYADGALIGVYSTDAPNIVAGSYQAQYIKYGGMVYKFNDAKELGAAILLIDPNSTHTAASYIRMSKDLASQLDDGSLEPNSLDQTLNSEQVAMEEQMASTNTDIATSTDPVATTTDKTQQNLQSTDQSTTTATTNNNLNNSTGTNTSTATSTATTTASSNNTDFASSTVDQTIASTTPVSIDNGSSSLNGSTTAPIVDPATSTPPFIPPVTSSSTPIGLDPMPTSTPPVKTIIEDISLPIDKVNDSSSSTVSDLVSMLRSKKGRKFN